MIGANADESQKEISKIHTVQKTGMSVINQSAAKIFYYIEDKVQRLEK